MNGKIKIRHIYKAAGWIPLGQTKGFTRVNRQDCDFYVPNGRPKAVWAKPLCKDALARVRLPRAEQHGELLGIQGGAAVRPQPRLQTRDGRDKCRHRQENRKRGVGRTIEDAMNAPEAPTEAPRPHSVRMDGYESTPN